MRYLLLSSLLLACSPAVPPPAASPAGPTQASSATVEGAWARAVPPGTPNSAVFFTVSNGSAALAEVVAATSPAAGAVELHTHVDDGGVMRMRRVEGLAVPGRGHLHLQPGGDHVMLIGLVAPLAEGGTVPVTLTFRDGSALEVQAPVRAAPPAAGHDHAHDHAHGDGHGGP